MNFWEKLAQQRSGFSDALSGLLALKRMGEALDDRYDGLIGALQKIVAMLDNFSTDVRRIDQKAVADTHKQLSKAIKDFARIRSMQDGPLEEDGIIRSLLNNFEAYQNDSLKPLIEALHTMQSNVAADFSVNMEKAIEDGRKHTMFSTDEDDPDEFSDRNVVGRLLWVGESMALASSVEQYDAVRLSKAYPLYEVMLRKMEESDPEKQLRYARLIASRETQLIKDVYQTRERLQKLYDGDSDKQRKVTEALIADKSYLAAKSFYAFKETLLNNPALGEPMRIVTQNYITPFIKGTPVSELVNGTLEQRLELSRRASSQEALQHQLENALTAFETTGIPMNAFSRELFELGTRFAKDPKRSSASPFFGIAAQLFELENKNLNDINSDEVQKQIRICYFTAKRYLATHRTVPYTANGKARVAIAKEVALLMRSKLSPEYLTSIEQQGAMPALPEALNARGARLLANVGTANIDTEVPEKRSTMPLESIRTDPKYRKDLHKFYSMLTGIEQVTTGLPSNIIGGGMWLVRKLKGKSQAQREAPSYDDEHVPFMREEKYREPEPNQLITDKRRIPLVWERRIPEDADQGPTLTFEVDQPYEGKAYGLGTDPNNVGHAFLTLRYSKINPMTGKRERYKTSFGFYPKYDGKMMGYLGAMIGSAVPGRIKEDFEHPVSVGATVNITTEQFNDIIRFTGSYEKGGYNMATRNCTDFALEAVKHAGIRIPELENVEKVDVTNKGPLGLGIGLVHPFTGHLLLNELHKKQILERMERKDNSQYTHIGQAEANKEDWERCSHTQLNNRLRGYAPGATGEAMRSSFAFSLHSKKYLGTKAVRRNTYEAFLNTIVNRRVEEDIQKEHLEDMDEMALDRIRAEKKSAMLAEYKADLKDRGLSSKDVLSDSDKINRFRLEEESTFLLEMLKQEKARLRRKIEDVYGRDNVSLNQVLDNMDTLHTQMQEAIEKMVTEEVTNAKISDPKARPGAMDTMTEITKALNGYASDLNGIFHRVFESDPGVNIPFQNMVSVIEHLRDHVEFAYDQACRMDQVVKMVAGAPDSRESQEKNYEFEQQLCNPERDASHAVFNAKFNRITYSFLDKNSKMVNYQMRPAELLSAMMSFDDPKEALQRIAISEDSDKPDSKAEAMKYLRATTEKALETFLDGHEYTDEELKAVFYRLPKLEQSLGINSNQPSAYYQTMALSAILGENFLGALDKDLNKYFMDLIESKGDALKIPCDPAEYNEWLILATSGDRRFALANRDNLSASDKKSYDEWQEAHQKLEQMNLTLNDLDGKEDLLKETLDNFANTAKERLNQKLNTLPEDKKKKLYHLTNLMGNSLYSERQDKAEAALKQCYGKAWKDLGEIITKRYMPSLCEKAISQLKGNPDYKYNVDSEINQWKSNNIEAEEKNWLPDFFKGPERNAAQRNQAGAQINAAQANRRRNSLNPNGNHLDPEKQQESRNRSHSVKGPGKGPIPQ